jgi:hypothetical protein
MAALLEQQSELVSNVLEEEPTAESYQLLKAALLSSHTLTLYQMVDKLVNLEPLGGRKPSELMAAMQKLRPPRDEHFFIYNFLQRLPKEVRILLAHNNFSNTRKLAEKADGLLRWTSPPPLRSWRLQSKIPSPQQLQGQQGAEKAAGRRTGAASTATAAAAAHQLTSRSRCCVFSTSAMVIRPTSVWNRVRGRETSQPGRDQHRLLSRFFAVDDNTSKKFLVDTGASYSIIPHGSSAQPSGPALRTANNMRMRCWGSRTAEVKIVGASFLWSFLLADVRFPILGIDFLRHHQLVVDVYSDRFLPRAALAQPVGSDMFTVARQECRSVAAVSEWDSILAEFPAVSQPFTVASKPAHGVEHSIKTTGRPTTAKFRCLDPVRLAAAKAEFDKMLVAGVVCGSSSNWSSPLHMVQKKCGGWRPCSDFRRLNNITVKDKYPLPNMGDLSARLNGCTIFSKLDL